MKMRKSLKATVLSLAVGIASMGMALPAFAHYESQPYDYQVDVPDYGWVVTKTEGPFTEVQKAGATGGSGNVSAPLNTGVQSGSAGTGTSTAKKAASLGKTNAMTGAKKVASGEKSNKTRKHEELIQNTALLLQQFQAGHFDGSSAMRSKLKAASDASMSAEDLTRLLESSGKALKKELKKTTKKLGGH